MSLSTPRSKKGVKKTAASEDLKQTGVSCSYASVTTNLCQKSSTTIPGDNMRSNLLGAIVSTCWTGDGNKDAHAAAGKKPSMSMILEGLYVGGAACVEDEKFLRANGITAVVTVLLQPVSTSPAHPLLRVVPLSDRLFVRARDTTTQDLIQFFPGVCEFIDKRLRPHLSKSDDAKDTDAPESAQEDPVPLGQASATTAIDDNNQHWLQKKNQRVLIHCEHNLSRSSALAAAYVMFRKRKSDEEALALVQRKTGYGAWPNAAFRDQLKLWWDVGFKIYGIEMFKVPCDEYEDYRFRLSLERALQACGEDE